MPSTPSRAEHAANRPRRSRVHHPRASRTIRGAFLARPATGRFCSLRRRRPRLGGLRQILANLGDPRFYGKNRGFAPPPPVHVHAELPSRSPPTLPRARKRQVIGRRWLGCTTQAIGVRSLSVFSRGLRRGDLNTEVEDPAPWPGRRRRRRPCSGANLAQRSARRQARLCCTSGEAARGCQARRPARNAARIVPDGPGCTAREH